MTNGTDANIQYGSRDMMPLSHLSRVRAARVLVAGERYSWR
jgi:hypothetical protein